MAQSDEAAHSYPPSPITQGNKDLSYQPPHLTHDHAANTEELSQASKGIRLGALGLIEAFI